jgi:hypothetical protein
MGSQTTRALDGELQALTDAQYVMRGTGFAVAEIELVLGGIREGSNACVSNAQAAALVRGLRSPRIGGRNSPFVL